MSGYDTGERDGGGAIGGLELPARQSDDLIGVVIQLDPLVV